MKRESQFVDEIIRIEGGYVNDPDDKGGETKYGITVAVARQNGYHGLMKDLSIEKAREIYLQEYFRKPGFDKVMNDRLAFELFDTSVNTGVHAAITFLQKGCNLLNIDNRYGEDLLVDGSFGLKTLSFVNNYPYPDRLFLLLNAVQCRHYLDLSERRPSQRKFVFGWLNERVFKQIKSL